MLSSSPSAHQPNLFGKDLLCQLDEKDPLVQLSHQFPWSELESAFSPLYDHSNGRPGKPIRLMVGLLLLKQLEDLSDEQVVLAWKRNPYYQYFCGVTDFQRCVPCASSELVHFRKRIGEAGIAKIFQCSVSLHGKAALSQEVIVDTTVQEKHIAYPTDGKLAIKIIHRLLKLGDVHGLKRRRSYRKEVKLLRIALRNFRHPRKRQAANKAMKRLRTIAGILLREAERKLCPDVVESCQNDFALYRQVLSQKKQDKNKIYSLHEPQVYCVGKGKDHKQYEYGAKASIVSTIKEMIIVGVASHKEHVHDSKTLTDALASVIEATGKSPLRAVCDRGYRGVTAVGDTQIHIPDTGNKNDTKYQRDKKRKRFRRRAAIEPVIGHLKAHYRLGRSFLKGAIGDSINLHMAATAWNLKKWILLYFCPLIQTYIEQVITIIIGKIADKVL